MTDATPAPAPEARTGADNNRRRFTRIFFDAETVLAQGDTAHIVKLMDVSLQGMLVQLLPEQHVQPDIPVEGCIHLGGDIQIRMTLSVVNHRGDRLGLHCENIDLDSLTHLRRLVELNLGDVSLLERELGALEHHG